MLTSMGFQGGKLRGCRTLRIFDQFLVCNSEWVYDFIFIQTIVKITPRILKIYCRDAQPAGAGRIRPPNVLYPALGACRLRNTRNSLLDDGYFINTGLFCDGTRRYGVPAPFFQSKEKTVFVMYIINE